MKRHQDVTIGIGILVFCTAAASLGMRLSSGSAIMPLILTGFMVLLGVLLIIGGFKKTRIVRQAGGEVEPLVTFQSLRVPYMMFLQIVIYAVLFYGVGFYVATVLFLLLSMRYLKQRSWKVIVLFSFGFVAFTYFFLARELNVSIDPLGILGRWLQMNA